MSLLQDILTPIDPSKSSRLHSHPLWALLDSTNGTAPIAPPFKTLNPALPLGSKDKTATSLRLLLCDAQNTLEGFSTKITTLAKDVERAASQMEETTKLVEDRQTASTGELKILLTRIQTSLSKSLDDTSLSVRALADKLDIDQAKSTAKQDNLQQQIIILAQQVALNHEEQKESRKLYVEMYKAQDEKLGRILTELENKSSRTASDESVVSKVEAALEKLKDVKCSCTHSALNPTLNPAAERHSEHPYIEREPHSSVLNEHPASSNITSNPGTRPFQTPVPQTSHFSLASIARPLQASSSIASSPILAPIDYNAQNRQDQGPRSRNSSIGANFTPQSHLKRPFAPLPNDLAVASKFASMTPDVRSRSSSMQPGLSFRKSMSLFPSSGHGGISRDTHDKEPPFSNLSDVPVAGLSLFDGVGEQNGEGADVDVQFPNKRFKGFLTPRRPVRRMIEQGSDPSPGSMEG